MRGIAGLIYPARDHYFRCKGHACPQTRPQFQAQLQAKHWSENAEQELALSRHMRAVSEDILKLLETLLAVLTAATQPAFLFSKYR